jgi:broad specificity phosphatase PhoE
VTTLLLIRHAACEQMSERLYGRTVAAALSPAGRVQARQLGEYLSHDSLCAIHSSPRDRARDTATAIAVPHSITVQVDAALDEVDFGEWSGLSFRELERDARWRAWNRDREHHRAPGGESIRAIQHRVLTKLRALVRIHPGERVAVVSHAEVIRSAVLAIRGWSPNRYEEVQIPPASVTTVVAKDATLAFGSIGTPARAGSAR